MFNLLKSLVEKLQLKFQWLRKNSPNNTTQINQKCKDSQNEQNAYLNTQGSQTIVKGDQYVGSQPEASSSKNTTSELSDYLNILYEFLNFGGKFCHSLGEFRCITLSMNEGKANYSYAERAQLFFSKGDVAAKECRDLLSKLPSDSSTKKNVKKILSFLVDNLRSMEMALISKMEGR